MENTKLLKELGLLRKQIRRRFAFVESVNDLPETWGGSGILHIDVDPTIAFHFLEFIFELSYIDIIQEAGFRFIDDKTTWEYFLMSENGFLRVYDWKRYTVSVGSCGISNNGTKEGLEKDAQYLQTLLEKNIGKFNDYKQAEYSNHLDEYPFDNFMDALTSLTLLFRDAINSLDDTHNYLEALILLVALLDTQLRYSILLTRINTRKSKRIDPDFWELFQQTEGGKFITERGIYTLAEQEIDFSGYDKESFFTQINKLYDIRNRAVHRFAITNFQYSESRVAVEAYRNLVDILYDIIKELEHEQVRLDVGFIKADELDLPEAKLRKELLRAIGGKVDSSVLLPRTHEREPMFSDDYPDGYHPRLKTTIEKIKKDLDKGQ